MPGDDADVPGLGNTWFADDDDVPGGGGPEDGVPIERDWRGPTNDFGYVPSPTRPAPQPIPPGVPLPLRVLAVGDIFGEPGRKAAMAMIPRLRHERAIDLVVANGENAAGGRGITRTIADDLLRTGVDVLTLGNHTWSQREMETVLKDRSLPIVRPLNYPPGVPGQGYYDLYARGMHVRVVSLMGRVFMGESLDDPFRTMDELLSHTPDDAIVLVDFHAEATSEKVAMGWHLDGRVAGVWGTHTHIPTADARILPQGTAFVTDLGMTGPQDSIIGSVVPQVLHRFLTGMPVRFAVATGPVTLNAMIIEIDRQTRRGRGVWRRDYWDVVL